jgi:hypothetical protein
MKYSKIVLSGLLAITIFGISCNNNNPNQSTGTVTSTPGPAASNNVHNPIPNSSSTSGGGLGLIATPRPGGGPEDQGAKEPAAFKTSAPFIIGKSAVPFGGGITSSGASGIPEPAEVIVPSKVSGRVWGYDLSSRSYHPLGGAQVSVGSDSLISDSQGYYTTEGIISSAADISAAATDYLTTTVSNVSPGDNRDIHLQPLENKPRFNQNTITMDFTSLNGATPTAVENTTADENPTPVASAAGAPARDFPSILTFADLDNSRFVNTLLNSTTGRYRLEVNPLASKTTATGQLLIFDVERDNQGRATNPTQMKSFILRRDVVFRVGDTLLPTSANEITGDNSKFDTINANFHDSNGFSDFVCNAYVIFPGGEKLLVSKYTGGSPTNLSFRVPRFEGVPNISYSIEAHSGTASKGSDVVINDLHAGDSVDAYLMPTPTGLTPEYNSTSTGMSPVFGWQSTGDSRGYQVEVQSTERLNSQGWEGFSKETSIGYPSLSPLKIGSQYRYQVIAMDFSFSRLSILDNKAADITARAVKGSGDLPFSVQLANHDTKSLPKGYRVSYDTVLFRAR